MVACVFLPLITYVIVLFLAFYEPTPFHYALSTGMFVVWIVMALFNVIVPSIGKSPAPCTMDTRDHPCEECGIVFFVLGFMISHHIVMVDHTHKPALVSVRTFFYLIYCMFSISAEVYIGFYSITQVAIGSAIGFLTSLVFSAFIYIGITPRFFDKRVQACLRRIGMRTEHYRSDLPVPIIMK